MNDDPVRPLHVHEPIRVEKRRLSTFLYLIALAASIGLVLAVMFGG